MKVLSLTKYGRMGASSRMRSIQYLPFSVNAGYEVTCQVLLKDELLSRRYRVGKYGAASLVRAYAERVRLLLKRNAFDVIWIEKEAFPWWPVSVELMLLSGTPYILDYDDAVFHSYDMHRLWAVRKLFGARLNRLMNKAALVTAGNRYLAQRASDAGAPWVEVLPTVVDLDRYPIRSHSEVHPDLGTTGVLRVVWIGSPSTAHYLNLLRETLKQVAMQTPFVLRVIGAAGVDIPGVEVETVAWTEDTEVALISSCAVGIMPLEDSPWEKGKCGYKLIQYMACSLPVVASAIGANVEIVEDGKSGYLATSSEDWVTALRTLLESSALRQRMGKVGRVRVENKYCLQQTGPRLVDLLRTVSKK
jgi:glycosyltransferase involved in cell wall biosynthesis